MWLHLKGGWWWWWWWWIEWINSVCISSRPADTEQLMDSEIQVENCELRKMKSSCWWRSGDVSRVLTPLLFTYISTYAGTTLLTGALRWRSKVNACDRWAAKSIKTSEVLMKTGDLWILDHVRPLRTCRKTCTGAQEEHKTAEDRDAGASTADVGPTWWTTMSSNDLYVCL